MREIAVKFLLTDEQEQRLNNECKLGLEERSQEDGTSRKEDIEQLG